MFDQIPKPEVSAWNALVRGYAQSESYKEVVVLFKKMVTMNIMPNCFTFPVVLKCCVALKEGEELHCFVIRSGFVADHFVGTSLIDMYSSAGDVGLAYKVFDEMSDRNVVAWTSMISGYISCKDVATARRLFDSAPERDILLRNTMISGYIEVDRDMVRARELFDEMPKRDVMSWNTILNGFANKGDVEACEILFEEMPERNVFSWNGLIAGYAANGRFHKMVSAFKRMLVEGGSSVVPNDVTLMTVLSACARLGALNLGKWVHLYADRKGFRDNLCVGNALINMYAKCGVLRDAINVFKTMGKKDLISWNTIINALAVHGHGSDAFCLFLQMQNAEEKPDGITFLGILCACAHMGLVEEGLYYFQSMVDDYSIVRKIEHYGCMVDVLSRAGFLGQAVNFVMKMPMEPDAVIWGVLLGACRVYKNVELARNPDNYVVLANIYGDLGRWKDVARFNNNNNI